MSGSEKTPGSPPGFMLGIVEGFYGRPWPNEARLAYADLLPELGLDSYLYCPKADPYLRRRWQEDWPVEHWSKLQNLAATYRERGLRFGIGLSPFALYRRYSGAERDALRAKIARLLQLEPAILALLFDDMPGNVPDLAERQAEIIGDTAEWARHTRLLMCPTYYSRDPALEQHFGVMPANYWSRLGAALPREVGIFWTGDQVCSRKINTSDLAPMVALLKRPLTLWDNYPVNDGAVRSKYLYCRPLGAREPGIRQYLSGHFCNPMNQAWLSLPALRGLAELHRGAALPDDWEARVLGKEVWSRLRRDRDLFQDTGLDGIDPDRREVLAAEYAAMKAPAAAEVAGWLRGDYAFDPDCLTD